MNGKLAGEDKFKRWQIAQKIDEHLEAEISVEDVALIKRLIGKAFGPIVVGPAFQLLESSMH
jgi:hypothetical protein